jgi:hypothetical protein
MSSALNFPTPVLTPIVGRPTNSTLQILQKQLYQNARSIASEGWWHMSPVEYLTRPNAIAFVIPVSPGILDAPAPAATAAMIAESKRVYNNDLMVFNTYQSVRTALQNQITAAVDPTYLLAINDTDFGISDVPPYAICHADPFKNHVRGIDGIGNRTESCSFSGGMGPKFPYRNSLGTY